MMKCFLIQSNQPPVQKNYNFFLTGATGILGSHVLFELLLKYIKKELVGKIVLLVRPDKKNTARQRILSVLTSSAIPLWLKKIPIDDLLSHIEIVESGLNDFSANKLPKGIKKYTVIHAAASVNLGVNEHSGIEIEENNFKGTLRLLHEITPFASQFVYVSTAYSSGHRAGNIDNDFLSLEKFDFRNHYEFFKNKTEKYIEQYCPLHGIDWKIFRPSIICGRLIDAPYYAISRFMVFYLFARYAVAMKSRMDGAKLRLHVPENAQINIVPVDFVAKSIIEGLSSPIQQLNIVHPENVSCRSLFKNGFGLIDFTRYTFLGTMPLPENPVEKMLYSTVGQQLGPYIDTPSHHFDTSALKKLMPDFSVPDIEPHFGGLLEFAANRKFAPLY